MSQDYRRQLSVCLKPWAKRAAVELSPFPGRVPVAPGAMMFPSPIRRKKNYISRSRGLLSHYTTPTSR